MVEKEYGSFVHIAVSVLPFSIQGVNTLLAGGAATSLINPAMRLPWIEIFARPMK
jgi:hypothetical protein